MAQPASHTANETDRQPDSSTSPAESKSSTTSPSPPKLPTKPSIWRRVLAVLDYKPPWVRWDPDNPPRFSLAMNLLYAFSAAFTVANLYYSHPILNVLAHDFGVSYETSAQVPTLAQAGYACGLVLLCPLADVFKRRPFILGLVWLTATLW